MIDFSYFCEVIFVVVGECKFSESSQFFFIWVLSFVIVYFADPCMLFVPKTFSLSPLSILTTHEVSLP